MKAKDLIEILRELGENKEVVVDSYGEMTRSDVNRVSTTSLDKGGIIVKEMIVLEID